MLLDSDSLACDQVRPTGAETTAPPRLVGANIASVPHYSPFRYPGGKTWLANIVRRWLDESDAPVLYEPFAGGGSMSLLAVIEGHVQRAVLLELDHSVASVWQTMLSDDAEWLIDRITSFRVTPERVADVLAERPRKIRTLAFQTLIKNRCRRGGVLAGGAGLLIKGERGNGITSRWYPDTLARRIRLIHQHRERIQFIEGDSMKLLPELLRVRSAAFFVDPPYPKLMQPRVKPLYSHFRLNHECLFRELASSDANFLLTYDDSDYVRRLALMHSLHYREIHMRNSNAAMKMELIISKKRGLSVVE